VGQSSKMVEIWPGGEKHKTPTFSKLMNFGPHILTLSESPRAELKAVRNLNLPEICLPKFNNGGDVATSV